MRTHIKPNCKFGKYVGSGNTAQVLFSGSKDKGKVYVSGLPITKTHHVWCAIGYHIHNR